MKVIHIQSVLFAQKKRYNVPVPNTLWVLWPKAPKTSWARVLLAIFVLMVVLLLVLFITAPKPKLVKEDGQLSQGGEFKRLFAEKINLDTDKDGLKDWEEAVYHTDPQNPDTDGDGTSDGEEINRNRNPLVKGPNDKVTPISDNPVTFVFDDQNITHLFTQKISNDEEFKNIINGKGGTVSPDAIVSYLSALPVDQIFKTPPAPDPKILNVVGDETEAAVKTYLRKLAIIFIRQGDSFQETEFEIAERALAQEKPAGLKKISPIIAAFAEIVKEANALAVPKNLLWFHQRLIVLLEKSQIELRFLQKVDTDPFGGYVAMQERVRTRQAVTDLYSELSGWLRKNNIALDPQTKLIFGQ